VNSSTLQLSLTPPIYRFDKSAQATTSLTPGARNGALAGMLVGALTVILWKNFLGHLGLYEIIPGFILATLAIVVFSKIGNGPSASMIKRFDEAEKEYQSA
jgi:Na+/proline symporter